MARPARSTATRERRDGGAADSDGPDLVIADDPDAGAAEAARRIAFALADAAGARGRADFATTGGSAAPALYRALLAADVRDRVPWAGLHVWWGDDRFAPRERPTRT